MALKPGLGNADLKVSFPTMPPSLSASDSLHKSTGKGAGSNCNSSRPLLLSFFQSVFGSYGRFPKKTKSTPVGSITKVLRVEELGRALKTELLNAPVVHQHHQGTRAISCSITDSGVIVQYDPHKAYVKVISAVIVKDEGCAVLKAKELAKSFRVGL